MAKLHIVAKYERVSPSGIQRLSVYFTHCPRQKFPLYFTEHGKVRERGIKSTSRGILDRVLLSVERCVSTISDLYKRAPNVN